MAIGSKPDVGDNVTADDPAGYVHIYEWTGNGWKRILASEGEAPGDGFGWSVALSEDGNRVAIGANYNDGNGTDKDSGHVQIFNWTGSQWNQVGQDLDGEVSVDYFGHIVALSADGNRVAVGAPDHDGASKAEAGHVRIFDWNGTQWNQVGQDLDGEAEKDFFGHIVALSADGNRVAIGAPTNDGIGDDAGHVRIFEWNESTGNWTQIGLDLDGRARNDLFGYSVALSADGNRLVIGTFRNGGKDAGSVRIFDWKGTQWEQFGRDLVGEVGVEFGKKIALSSDGNRLAIAAAGPKNGNMVGSVHFFELDAVEAR